MAHMDITLYADGALRLTRHGAGRGGNVLVHVPTNAQCDIPDSELARATRFIEAHDGASSRHLFDCVAEHCERKRA